MQVLAESMRVLEAIEQLIRMQLRLPPEAPLPAQMERAGSGGGRTSGAAQVAPELLDALEVRLRPSATAVQDLLHAGSVACLGRKAGLGARDISWSSCCRTFLASIEGSWALSCKRV